MLKKLAFFLVAVICFVGQAQAVDLKECRVNYNKITGKYEAVAHSDLGQTDLPTELIRSRIVPAMEANSRAVAERLRTATQSGRPEVFDMVTVGGGPHAAMAMAGAREANASLRTLSFEAKSGPGVFAQMGDTFNINTRAGGSNFSGSPLRTTDVETPQAGSNFPSAQALGDATYASHYAAGNPVVFNQKIVSITEAPTNSNWPARYKLRTADGTEVYSNNVLIATGLGRPKLGIQVRALPANAPAAQAVRHQRLERAAEQTNRLVEKVRKETGTGGFPTLGSMDEMMEFIAAELKAGRKNPIAAMAGEEIAVIGAKDGGRIAVQALSGSSAALNTRTGAAHSVAKIIFVGEKSKTGQEYLQSLSRPGIDARIAERYAPIAEQIDNGRVQTSSGYLDNIEEIWVDGKRKFRITQNLGTPEETARLVDRVIFTRGYDSEVPAVLGDLGDAQLRPTELDVTPDARYPSMMGQQHVADQVVVNGRPTGIYNIGNSSSVAPTNQQWLEADLASGGGFIDLLGDRSRAFGRSLASQATPTQNPVRPVLNNVTEGQASGVSFPANFNFDPAKLRKLSNEAVEAGLRLELSRSLTGVTSRNGLSFEIVYSNGNLPFFSFYDLTPQSSEALNKMLQENQELMAYFFSYTKNHPESNRLRVVLGNTPEGLLNFSIISLTR